MKKNVVNKIKNYFFLKKYPIWKEYDLSYEEKFLGYSDTMYDWIPKGWRKAFGKELSNELMSECSKYSKTESWKNIFRVSDVKEKWGRLIISATCTASDKDNKIFNILDKYEDISWNYCIDCGKPSKYQTKGWIAPYCHKCIKNHINSNDNIEDYLKPEFKDNKTN